MKKLIVSLFLLISIAGWSASEIKNRFSSKKDHYLARFNNQSFVNWSGLFYYATFIHRIAIEKKDNFVQKTLYEQQNLIKIARKAIFQHIMTIDVNNEITVKELLDISASFQKKLTRKFFSPDILLPAGQAGYRLSMSAFFPFKGKDSLTELILSSGYFIETAYLRPVKSQYQPVAYKKLILEARHFKNLKPALFPNIYSFDARGKKILIYSLAHSNKSKIIENGYISYQKKLKNLKIGSKDIYYCPVLKIEGSKKTDLIISRENYIKFFASPVSLKHLSEGGLIVVAPPVKK